MRTLNKPHTLALGVALALSLSAANLAMAQEETNRERGPKVFAELDSDANGGVSFAEFSSQESGAFDRLDSDANGVLTLDEMLNARPFRRGPDAGARASQSQERTENEGAEQGHRHAKRHAMMQEMMTSRFSEMDANGDEQISREEFLEAGFLRLDTDNNGELSEQELKARGDRKAEHQGKREERGGGRKPRA